MCPDSGWKAQVSLEVGFKFFVKAKATYGGFLCYRQSPQVSACALRSLSFCDPAIFSPTSWRLTGA